MADVINPMMYRVFLQDEKDAPYPAKNTENTFRLRHGELLSWYYDCPVGYRANLESQLNAMEPGTELSLEVKKVGEHFVLQFDGGDIEIVPKIDERRNAELAYQLAKQEAEDLAKHLSEAEDNPYIFIDLTSRGDRKEAERLAMIVHTETYHIPSPSSVDLGD